MCNCQPKNKDWIVPDFITVDMGDVCIECYQDTSFGSGYFVNRLPADRMVEDDDGNETGQRIGYLCTKCSQIPCDRCGEGIYIDEDITCHDLYGFEKAEFDDGAYRVHEHCLTKEEKKKFDEVYAEDESDYEKYRDDPRNLANDPRFKRLQG